jgi:hypothetical protein
MNHKQKLRLARQLQTDEEKRDGVKPFSGKGWVNRKAGIAKRVSKKRRGKLPERPKIERPKLNYNPAPATRTWWQRFIDWVKGRK